MAAFNSLALTMAQRLKAGSAYRHIIRSAKFTFKSDRPTYKSFMNHTKQLFRTKILNPSYLISPDYSNSHVEHSSSSTTAQTITSNTDLSGHDDPPVLASSLEDRFQFEIDGVYQVSNYLTRNLIQAHHSQDNQRLRLRFTDKIELGDNDSIKKVKKSSSSVDEARYSSCCQQQDSSCSSDDLEKSTTINRLSPAAIQRREARRIKRLQQQQPPEPSCSP